MYKTAYKNSFFNTFLFFLFTKVLLFRENSECPTLIAVNIHNNSNSKRSLEKFVRLHRTLLKITGCRYSD